MSIPTSTTGVETRISNSPALNLEMMSSFSLALSLPWRRPSLNEENMGLNLSSSAVAALTDLSVSLSSIKGQTMKIWDLRFEI